MSVGTKGKAPVEGGKAAPISFHHLDNSTIPLFFTNIPEEAETTDLWRCFAQFGFVAEVFIPKKLDKWGHRFGFVKFQEVQNEEALDARLEEVWLWNTRLKVNRESFSREANKAEEGKKKPVGGIGGVGPSVPVTTHKTFKAALSKAPNPGSWKGELKSYLEVTPSEDMMQKLEWCYVGELVKELDASSVQMRLVMKGISKVKVTGDGGRFGASGT